ncbi:cold shock domain-containing protein [Lewinella sp. LCG006]|uniref:cold shock domain-containing protein n=1 Tax=Lewinella sp. LCG006 TaxID=3231911 RepID=UPI00345F3E4D
MILDKIKAFFQSGSKGSSSSSTTKRTGGHRTGTIRYFNYRKGYGFISCPELEDDTFVHVSDTNGSLRKGDRVTFRIEQEDKGPRAREVEVLK